MQQYLLFLVDAVVQAGQRVYLEETFAVEQYLLLLVEAVFQAGQRVYLEETFAVLQCLRQL